MGLKHMRKQRTGMHAATYDPVVQFLILGLGLRIIYQLDIWVSKMIKVKSGQFCSFSTPLPFDTLSHFFMPPLKQDFCSLIRPTTT